MPDAAQLDARIVAFIDTDGRSEPFESLAGDLFAFQFQHNTLYGQYCRDIGVEPGRAGDLPAIPAAWPPAWRLGDLRTFPPEDAAAVFLSSGTTGTADVGGHGRSRHWFDTLDLYRAAFAGPFAEALLPGPAGRAPILVLMPPPQAAPDSSLSFMMGEAVARFGDESASGFFVHGGQLLVDEFAEACRSLDAPAVVASTAFGWVMLLDALDGETLPLPPGSRAMETGGYKGRSAEWDPAQLRRRLCETFGLSPDDIVGEYGMCELSSQFYRRGDGPFVGPAWVRTWAIDPETQRPTPSGEPGLLRVMDLANRGSCIAVQTEDLAVARGERSFDLLGRAPTAAPKGCSLTAEDLLGGGPD